MENKGKINFEKDDKVKRILTADVGKLWLVVMLIVGIGFLFSADTDGFFQVIGSIGIIVISVLAMIFLK